MHSSTTDEFTRASSVIARFAQHKRRCDADIHSRCTNIVTAFKAAKGKRQSQLYSSIQTLTKVWRQYAAEQIKKNRYQGHLFNPLFFFNISETKHSQLLGYLLKPTEKHGQGNTFLVSFLNMLDVPNPDQGDWRVMIEHGRIDILLIRNTPIKSIIIIENKSNDAVDQPNQLYRYWFKVIHPVVGNQSYANKDIQKNFKVIYLPSSEHKSPGKQSLQRPEYIERDKAGGHDRLPLDCQILDYNSHLATWLNDVKVNIPTSNVRLRSYLEFYSELCLSL